VKRIPIIAAISLFLVLAIGGWARSSFDLWGTEPIIVDKTPPLQLTPDDLNESRFKEIPLKLNGQTLPIPIHPALTTEACGPSWPKPLHWADTVRAFCLNLRAGSPPAQGAEAAFIGLGLRQGTQEVLTTSGWRWQSLKIDKEFTLPQVIVKLKEMAPRGTSGEIFLPERSVSLENGYRLYSGDFHHLESGARVACAVGEVLVENKGVLVFSCSRFTDGALAARYMVRNILYSFKKSAKPSTDYLPGGPGEQLFKLLTELENKPETETWAAEIRGYLEGLLERDCPIRLNEYTDVREVMDCREQTYAAALGWIQDTLEGPPK
jgi:hypothetical protein